MIIEAIVNGAKWNVELFINHLQELISIFENKPEYVDLRGQKISYPIYFDSEVGKFSFGKHFVDDITLKDETEEMRSTVQASCKCFKKSWYNVSHSDMQISVDTSFLYEDHGGFRNEYWIKMTQFSLYHYCLKDVSHKAKDYTIGVVTSETLNPCHGNQYIVQVNLNGKKLYDIDASDPIYIDSEGDIRAEEGGYVGLEGDKIDAPFNIARCSTCQDTHNDLPIGSMCNTMYYITTVE